MLGIGLKSGAFVENSGVWLRWIRPIGAPGLGAWFAVLDPVLFVSQRAPRSSRSISQAQAAGMESLWDACIP